jgi:hypothetical protein
LFTAVAVLPSQPTENSRMSEAPQEITVCRLWTWVLSSTGSVL